MADEIVEKLESTTLDDLELKKKKKKDKKEKKKDAGDGEEVVEKKEKKKKDKKKGDDALPEFSLGDKKKKPKKDKSKKSSKDDDDEGGDDTAAVGELDLGKKKKDKKKVKKEDRPVSTKASVWGNMEQLDETQMANHTYDNLLVRVFDRMEQQGVGKGSKGTKRIVCKPPTMVRIGTKKSGYQNFGQTCRDFNRSTKHVMQYILHETGTSGNLDITEQLIMRGRFKPAHMENILRDYIKEYVQCATCKSANTTLDKIDRLTFMNCMDCSSRRTVASMQAGFQAVVGKRKKLREKQGVGAGNAATQ